jgi:RNA polymerase sigma-70 factor (ECF subfamily)
MAIDISIWNLLFVLPESLTPLEHAALTLRVVFDCEYHEIAAIIGQEEIDCRQLVRRAKKTVSRSAQLGGISLEAQQRTIARFVEAARDSDTPRLMSLLSENVVLWADMSEKVTPIVKQPVYGRNEVAEFIVLSRCFVLNQVSALHIVTVNEQPGIIVRHHNVVEVVVSFTFLAAAIQQLYLIGNPNKLRHL